MKYTTCRELIRCSTGSCNYYKYSHGKKLLQELECFVEVKEDLGRYFRLRE